MTTAGWYLKNFAILALAALLYFTFAGMYRGVALFPPALLLGQGIVLVGGLIEITHYLLLRRDNETVAEPTSLETARGLYKFVRHPMYFGDLLILIGFVVMMANAMSVAIACLGLYGIARQVRIEDARLHERFGREASQWQQSTRTVIPFLW